MSTFENCDLNAAMVTPAYTGGPTSRVSEGVIRSTTGGEVEQMGVSRSSSLDSQKGATTILGTALNNAGSPTALRTNSVSVEIEPGNPASRVSLGAAVNLGYLTLTPSGDYVETASGSDKQAQQPQDAPKEPESALFDGGQEQAFGEAIADVPQVLYDSAMTQAANLAASSGSVEEVINALSKITADLSSQSGVPSETLIKAQQIAQQQFQRQADATIKALGVDPQELYKWAKENQAQALGRAVRDQVSVRSVEGYKALAKTYLTKVAPSTQVLQQNGYAIKEAKPGQEEMVQIDGMWLSVKTAARIGLV
jgi:hypothetical protein